MGRVLPDLWNIRGGFRLGAGLRHTHPELDPNTTKLQKYPNYTYITNFPNPNQSHSQLSILTSHSAAAPLKAYALPPTFTDPRPRPRPHPCPPSLSLTHQPMPTLTFSTGCHHHYLHLSLPWEVTPLRLRQLCPSPPWFVSNSCFVLGFSWWIMKWVCRGFLVSQMGFWEFLVSWVFLLCFYLSLCVCVLNKFMYFVCFYLFVSLVVVIAWFWVLVSFIDFDLDFYACVCIRICVFMLGFVFACILD